MMKLRLCLLCNHRLGLSGNDRVTPYLLENGDGGVYRLLAFDQLLHGYDLGMYETLKNKSDSSPASDISWQSFLSAAIKKSTTLPGTPEPMRPLVSFFAHNNRPEVIACHCLKQLVTRGKLSKAVEWLKYIISLEEHLGIAAALWMWENHIRTRCYKVSLSSEAENEVMLNPKALALVIQLLHPLIKYSEDEDEVNEERLGVADVVSEEPGLPLWPPSHDQWIMELQESLECQPLNRAAVRLHLSLVQAQLAQAKAGLAHWDLRDLYSRPDDLCAPNALQRPCEESRQDVKLKKVRLRFLSNGLKRTPFEETQILYELAESFAIPRQEVRNLHVVVLLELQQDSLAEHVLLKCDDVTRIADILVQVFQQRLSYVLTVLEKNRRYTHILAQLDADSVEWIRSAESRLDSSPSHPPKTPRGSSLDLSNLPILSTHHILRIVLRKIKPGSPSIEKADALLQVLGLLLQIFEGKG